MGRKKNSFSKAIKHLKSKNIDEKLEMLNEIPTNNTSSIYSVVPNSVTVGVDISQTVPDYSSIDFEVDGNDGRDTSGLFDESGNSKFIAPPGDNSYILGPMAAMYYTWSTPWTKIGYIRESDRRMVNLGTLYSTLHIGGDATGKLSDWDGNLRDGNGNQIFYANGQLTLEQAQWFLNTPKKDNAGNDPANANYRAFYPGPPSNAADEFGRYLCTMTGTPKGTREDIISKKTAPMGQQGSDNFSAILDRQGQGGSGSLKATYDLDYFNQTGKKPKNAPKNWDKMSDKKKKEWLEKNPQTLSFDYKDGRFQERPPEEQQQQSGGLPDNPFDSTTPNLLSDLPLSKLFDFESSIGDFDSYFNYGTGRDGGFGTGTSGEGMPSNPDFRGAGNNKNTSSINTTQAGGSLSKYTPEQQEIIRNFRANRDTKGEIKYISELQLAAKSDAYQKGELSALGQVEYRAHQLFHNINNILSPVTDFTDKFNSIVGPIVGAKTGFVPKTIIGKLFQPTIATLVPKATTTLFAPADNGISYNLQHAAALVGSIVTAKPFEVKTTGDLRNEAIANLDAEKIKEIVRFGSATKIGAETTIRPTEGKKGDIFKDGNLMGIIGGYEFSVDGNTFTMIAQKMVRTDEGNFVQTTTSGGKYIDPKDATGKITRFQDIPEIADKDLSPLVDKIIRDPNSIVNKVFSTQAQIFDKFTSDDAMKVYDIIKNDPDALNDVVDQVSDMVNSVEIGSKVSNAIQGAASNSVAVRKILTKLGFPKSQAEKEGKGYGQVFTVITGNINELSTEVQKAINDKRSNSTVKESISWLSHERKTDIMKTLKDPIVIRETKQKSYKVKPGRRSKKSNYHQGMDKLIGDVKPQKSFKKPQNMWSQGWQEYNARSSQDRKNIVLEKIGESKHAWKYMLEHGTMMDAKNLEEFWGKNPDFYSYFFNGKKYKTVRKEQVKGDYVVFLVDESGAKSSMLQSELNIKLIEEEEKKMLEEYNKLNNIESIPYEKDPLFKKVSKKLKKEIDYPEKPAKKGYPNQPPPKLGPDGFHPDFGKKYKYDKLDPISATTMSNAPTGNPEIDANVKKASLKSKVKEGYSDWRSEIEKK